MPPPPSQIHTEAWLREQNLSSLTAEEMSGLKQMGYSDAQIGKLTGHSMMAVRARRKALGVQPAYKRVDTCAAEFDVSVRLAPGLDSLLDTATDKCLH